MSYERTIQSRDNSSIVVRLESRDGGESQKTPDTAESSKSTGSHGKGYKLTVRLPARANPERVSDVIRSEIVFRTGEAPEVKASDGDFAVLVFQGDADVTSADLLGQISSAIRVSKVSKPEYQEIPKTMKPLEKEMIQRQSPSEVRPIYPEHDRPGWKVFPMILLGIAAVALYSQSESITSYLTGLIP